MSRVVDFESEDAVNSYLASMFNKMENGEIKPADARNDLAELVKAAMLGRKYVDHLLRQGR